MKFLFKIFVTFSIPLFLCGCEKTFNTIIDLDIKHTPIMALECIEIADSTIASISSTVSVTGTQLPSSINNAKVFLYENNTLIDSFKFNPLAGYKCPFINYKPNFTYKITASAPSFNEIEASDYFPSKVNIAKAEFVKTAKTISLPDFGITGQLFDEFKITFNNDFNIKDFYEINIYSTDGGGDNYFVISNDIDIDPSGEGDFLNGNVSVVYPPFTMNDANFNGKEKTLTFYALSNNTDQINTFWNIQISHLTENYYKFDKSSRLYRENDGNPFAEPVQIFSNVKNGVGIFALKNDTLLVY